jgi:hypothetical protein
LSAKAKGRSVHYSLFSLCNLWHFDTGMFLYARVVMDNIRTCATFDSIQSELKALPESLEEAWAMNIVDTSQNS